MTNPSTPPHNTTDQAVREAKARWQRRRRRLIGYGQWHPFVDAAPVRAHIAAVRATGMSLKTISDATGVGLGTLDYLMYGDKNHPPAERIRPETADTLLNYWPALDDYADLALIDSTGTVRRARALAAIGWPMRTTSARIGVGPQTLEKVKDDKRVTATTARALRDFYHHAARGKAEEHGVTPWIAERTRNIAARNGWAPPVCWDDDTIGDPHAVPQWTGHCGTDRGWWQHRASDIPVCPPCQQAHETWKAERSHLPSRERVSQIRLAQAAAQTRGANLAEEARRLFSHGYDLAQAAARLDVKKDTLSQELRRHPETSEWGEAA